MRKVMVSKRAYSREKTDWILEQRGEALFHQFGIDFAHAADGICSFTSAIIEWGDGSVENVPVNLIKFIGGENE